MSKITLDVDDKNLDTVMTVLNNLKAGLIQDISVSKMNKIKPVKSSLDKIETQATQQVNANKYLSKSKYKQKINQKPEEDEFLPKTTATGKYLSKDAYKKKLQKK